jgi:hypothetical protein
MRNPREIPDDTFEKIRPFKRHGAHLAKSKRGKLSRCNGKNSYREDDAEYARQTLLRLGRAAYLRVYRCTLCTYWHLTSQPPRKR